jgi:hypothetical protein
MLEQNYCLCNKSVLVRLHSLFFCQSTFRGCIAELPNVAAGGADIGHWTVLDLRYAISVELVSVAGRVNDTALCLSN